MSVRHEARSVQKGSILITRALYLKLADQAVGLRDPGERLMDSISLRK